MSQIVLTLHACRYAVTVVPEEPTRDTPSAARTASATVGAKPAEVLEDAGPEATTVRMRALYDYEVSDTDDGGKLALNLGDTIIVTDTSDERWWFGHLEAHIDKAGFFPKDFVKLISDEECVSLPPQIMQLILGVQLQLTAACASVQTIRRRTATRACVYWHVAEDQVHRGF